MNQAELTDLCKNTSYKFKKKGEKICLTGDKDDSMYIILRGKVLLSVPRKEMVGIIKENKSIKPHTFALTAV